MTEHATRAAWVAIYELPDPSFMERWTFAHVSGNGSRQASRKRYTTKWGAKRAARKLYPDVEIREKPAR